MYSASFDYHAPATLTEALALLDRFQDEAKVISGSQSLVPLMKLRLAQPKHLVDLRKVPGLAGIREAGGVLEIGGMTTYRAVEMSTAAKAKLPVLAETAGQIGDPQVRNLGTIGGSLAHADPSADWPAVLVALGASVKIAGKKGERTVPVEEFIVGPLSTVLEAGEIVVQVRVPLPGARSGSAYEKYPHPASRFAIVGVAAALLLDAQGKVQGVRAAVTGLGSKVSRARALEQALTGKAPDAAAISAAAARAAEGIELYDDLNGSAKYRAHLAAVVAERALTRAASRASA